MVEEEEGRGGTYAWRTAQLQIGDEPVRLLLNFAARLPALYSLREEVKDIGVRALPPPASMRQTIHKQTSMPIPAHATLSRIRILRVTVDAVLFAFPGSLAATSADSDRRRAEAATDEQD